MAQRIGVKVKGSLIREKDQPSSLENSVQGITDLSKINNAFMFGALETERSGPTGNGSITNRFGKSSISPKNGISTLNNSILNE